MEKMHLPISLDTQKGIERDEHFRIGGTYKKYMSAQSSKVNIGHVNANKKHVKDHHKFLVYDHSAKDLGKVDQYDQGFKPN